MRGLSLIALVFASVSSFAATMDPASKFVHQTLTRGREILENKSAEFRRTNTCTLLKTSAHSGYLTSVWLGDYMNLTRDQAGINSFEKLVPSILMTKLSEALGGNSGEIRNGQFSVAPQSTHRGNGYYAVDITISGNGSTYSGVAVVLNHAKRFYIVDLEYMGYSGANFIAQEYRPILDEDYQRDTQRSRPVTTLVNQLKKQPGFILCR